MMEVLRLWCDEEQLGKVKTLPSCRRVEPSKARTLRGWERVYIVFGDNGLGTDIDIILGENDSE